MPYRFEPATAAQWDDLARLFGARGACGGCWCMAWRKLRPEFQRDKGERNRESLRALVHAGPPPGILAYAGDEPAGWCAVAPREVYVTLGRSRVLRSIDAQPVWSVSCFFVARAHRGAGLTVGLLRAAIEFVKAQGGTILEGYPAPTGGKRLPAPFVWTGLLNSFLRAGFQEVPGRSASRPMVRYLIPPE